MVEDDLRSKGFDDYTYTSFPPALYRRFLERYVTPFAQGFEECLDLGCGSGGLIAELLSAGSGAITGVDVSEASIRACHTNPFLQQQRVRFLREDVLDLAAGTSWRGRFDLIVSYSVLHFVPGTTDAKLRLLRDLCRPGALVALDALARIPWNLLMFSFVKGLIRIGAWGLAVRTLAPLVGPSFPKSFIEELARMKYLRHLRYRDFLDLDYLRSAEFENAFELLRLDVVPQDGFFTGRKARFALRRR